MRGVPCRESFLVLAPMPGDPAISPKFSNITQEHSPVSEPVLTTFHGPIIQLTLNRPETYNALNIETAQALIRQGNIKPE